MKSALKTRKNKLEIEPTVTNIVSRFLNEQDVTQSSRSLYSRTLKQFFDWISSTNKNLSDLTRQDIIEYKKNMITKGLSSLTVGSYITVLRKFYEWTESVKIYPNIAKGIKLPRRKQEFRKQSLSENQVSKLLQFAANKKSLRDFAIINLAVRTGLRTIEIVNANIEDITFKGDKRVLMVKAKVRLKKIILLS